MYILGHMALSYIVCRLVGRALRINVPMYLALLIGAVPDFDIYFLPLGFKHHTLTHSILSWIPIFLGLMLIYGRRSMPYVAGVASHFLVADFLANGVPLLLPLSEMDFGLHLGTIGRNGAFLEVGLLILAAVVANEKRELLSPLSPDARNALMSLPLFALVSLTLLFADEFNVNLIEYGFSTRSLSALSLSHLLLTSFLGLSTIQGLRGLLFRRHEAQRSL